MPGYCTSGCPTRQASCWVARMRGRHSCSRFAQPVSSLLGQGHQTRGSCPDLCPEALAKRAHQLGKLWAGTPNRPDIALPVPPVIVPPSIADYYEAVVAVQRCVHTCTLLFSNQRHLMVHADLHTIALTQHSFVVMLPVPLPVSRNTPNLLLAKV